MSKQNKIKLTTLQMLKPQLKKNSFRVIGLTKMCFYLFLIDFKMIFVTFLNIIVFLKSFFASFKMYSIKILFENEVDKNKT